MEGLSYLAAVFFFVIAAQFLWISRLLKKSRKFAVGSKDKEEEIKEAYNNLFLKTQEISIMNGELEKLYGEKETAYIRFEKMSHLIASLNTKNLREKDVFRDLLNIAVELIPEADYGTVFIIEERKTKFIATIGHNLRKLSEIEIPENSLDLPSRITIFNFTDPEYENWIVKGKVIPFIEPSRSSIVAPLFIENNCIGAITLEISKKKHAEFTEETKRVTQTLEILASSFLEVRRYAKLQGEFHRNIVISLVKALEFYDTYTYGHSERVAKYSTMLAEKIGLDGEKIRKIYWASLVHDVGKIFVQQNILNKTANLTADEFEEIKKHPGKGATILQETEGMERLSIIVRFHHERWDGRGYPEGLEKDEIPFESRIISLGDCYDAMTSGRPYRKTFSFEQAIEEIRKNSGKQFDPELAKSFIEMIKENSMDT